MDNVGAVILVVYLIVMALCIFSIVLQWKMFVKAATPGWHCLIPFYNTYEIYRLAKLPVYLFIISLFLPVINIYATYQWYKCYGMSTGLAIASLFVPFLGPCCVVFGTYEYEF